MLKHYHQVMPHAAREDTSATPAKSERVAFFGGSFDPPHNGHLAVARAARAALHLGRILFAPVGAQPLKPHGSTASFDHRLAMTRLAIAEEPGFEVSLVDAPTAAGRPNYSYDTLLGLRSGLAPGSTLFCLMGADSFLGLRQWHRAAELPFLAPLIVASRPGQQLTDLKAALPAGLTLTESAAEPGTPELRCLTVHNSAGATAPFYLLPGLHVDISATQIRHQIRADHTHQPTARLLPPAVADYIALHHLYR